MLALVAEIWWPGAGVVYLELEWLLLYPYVQQYCLLVSLREEGDTMPLLQCRPAIVLESLALSWRATKSFAWAAETLVVRVLCVAVRAATEARSLSVAVARLAMASTVSCW